MSSVETPRRNVTSTYSNLPLTFVANAGQGRSHIRYLTNRLGFGIGFTSEEAMFTFNGNARDKREGLALALQFLGANPAVKLEARRQDPVKINYMRGSDPANWHIDLPSYREVIYRELWQGVDMIFHGEKGKLKYEVIVQPGAGLDTIRFAYRGADRLTLDTEGNLLVHTPLGILTEERPVSFQEIAGQKIAVESRFAIKQNEPGDCVYGFEIDDYDVGHALIIDPALDYSTYLGGSATETGFAIAVDGSGNAYVTGQTISPNFPLAPGAFQTAIGASSDAFVSKLNAEGTALIYSTFLGGNGLDLASAIAVDGMGNAYVTGQTLSSDFPVTPGAFQTTLGGNRDAFVTKLSADGSALSYSTYLGGSSVDNGNAIAVDGSGNAYVAGSTASSNFPVTSGAFQTAGGDTLGDVFVTKLNADGSALVYSTFIVGNSIDEGFAIAVDGSGNAYVAGRTFSADFPTTPGAFQIASAGSAEAFALKLNAAGTALVYSTFLGGSGSDTGKGIAIDGSGNAYLAGLTFSTDFPVTPGAFQPTFGGVSDAFVTKLNADGTALVYSTYLGGSGSEDGTGIEVFGGSAYVTGSTGSGEFPVTPDAIQPTLAGGSDVYLTQFNVTGSSLVFSTYLGGGSNDGAMGIAVDGSGSAYLTGQTVSSNYPVTPGAFQQALAGGGDSFVTKIAATADLAVQKFPDRFEVRPGETVTFFIEVSNPGAVTLTDVAIEDPLLDFSGLIPELAPGEVRIFEVAFTVPISTTPGLLVNTAAIKADQLPEPVIAESEILVTEAPALLAAKTVNPPAAAPEETVVFTILIQNVGNVDLFNVRVTDPLIGLDQTINTIRIGETITIDWPFVIPADAQAGTTISNILTITADNLPQSEELGAVVEVLPVPRLVIFKAADRSVVRPGETVNFTIEVVNTGNTELFNINVTDDLTGFQTIIPVLLVGQSQSFVTTFFVSLESPPITYVNTAVAISNQTELVFATSEVTVAAEPRLGISKIPETTSVVPGQTILYTVRLENIGNVPLTGIRIVDPVLGIDQLEAVLQVGEVRELVLAFTIPPEPIGSDIVNLLTVQSAELEPQEVESLVTVTSFGLSLLKESDHAAAVPGATVTYTLTVANLLEIPQTNVVLTDALLGLNETIPSLSANESVIRTLTFVIPADAAPGTALLNTFIVSSDQTPSQETTAEVVVLEPPGPALVIRKLPDRNAAAPGDTVAYTLTATNLLDVIQTNVVLTDVRLGLNETVAILLANETITRTLTFTVPADAEIGSTILNTFTVVSDQSPLVETIAEVVVQAPPGPSLLVRKLPDRNTAAPGETVFYTLTVTNLLGVDQSNVVVTDELLGLSETVGLLLANATITRTLMFTIPADAVPGSVIRNTVAAVSDQSPPAEATSEVIVSAAPPIVTTLTVRKRPDRNDPAPGDTVRYTVEVSNIGEHTATNIVVRDSLTGERSTIPVIAPGETAILSFAFPVSADTPQGTVIANRVTVTWPEQPPGSLPVQDEVRVIVAVPAELPEVEVEAQPESPRPGETVLKTITITNVTGIALTNVRVFDQLLNFRTIIPSLAPGESRVFALRLPIPPEAAGGTNFRNTISVFSDETPLQQQEVTVQTQSLPDALLTETVDRPIGRAGETVFFTIQARNTGNVPLLNVRLSAPLLGIQLQIAQFDVGASETLRVPFVLPDVEEDTIIVSPVTLISDNGPPREASASVKVIAEEEE